MYMRQIVTITSQGQITIPAAMRRAISIDKYNKALASTDGNRIIVEPVEDLLTLAGTLKKKAKTGKKIAEIIKLEEKAVAKMVK